MLTRRTFSALALATTAFPFAASAATLDTEDLKGLVESTPPVPLPKDIVWETNDDAPLIGSDKAIRGGRLNVALGAYPLTFRMMGPNNNDFFASWNRQFFAMSLVTQHPTTDAFIPLMATHWSIQKDQQTIYFKLDPDAKFSDGHPVTADDYVFTWRMMQSKHIVDPFFNTYVERYLTSVDKIDDHTIRIVGTRPSWRPLYDYSMWPTPAHATVVDKDWVTRTNNEPLIVAGPYVVSGTSRGESVTFKRVPNWWGDNKRYFKGLYNFDEIHLRVIPSERELDYVRQGELDFTIVPSKIWYEGLDFPAIQNGWLRRARIFLDLPSGLRGLQMNLQAPIFQNRDFRLAVQHLLNFDRLNRNLSYGETFRKRSFFDGTEFANPDVKAYPFDPAKAVEHLERAGYKRRDVQAADSLWAQLRRTLRGVVLTRSDTDEIRVNDKGEKASFTVLYYSKANQGHLTVIQEDFRRAGVDMRLQLMEPGAAFTRGLERKFEMMLLAMTSGLYPEPRQYLHTDFKNSVNNNDFWGFGTQEVDDLIKTYEESLDADARRQALFRVDQIVHDEAFYLPFWDVPFLRMVHWDYLQFPEFYLPRRTEQPQDWLVYWIDPDRKAALETAMRDGKAYPVDESPDKDFFNVKQKYQ